MGANYIGDAGATALSENVAIEYIDVKGNGISPDGERALAERTLRAKARGDKARAVADKPAAATPVSPRDVLNASDVDLRDALRSVVPAVALETSTRAPRSTPTPGATPADPKDSAKGASKDDKKPWR